MLPIAIDADVVIAVGYDGADDVVTVCNTNEKYQTATFPADASVPVDIASGVQWYKYVQCGYKGAFEGAKAHGKTLSVTSAGRLRLCLDGTIPPSAGLSSSAAGQ